MINKCKICGAESHKLFETLVLGKHNISYYQCENCEFIETEKPFWLEEAYGSAISKLDIGLIYRNTELSGFVESLLLQNSFDADKKFIDYGGGYGMFVRMMRDKGFDFFRQDMYCENLFAEFFDIEDLENDNQNFEILTAFEVFEHLLDPMDEIKKMLKFSNTIIFSTELIPVNKKLTSTDDWWYFVPEGGQHIAFYSLKSLAVIAKNFNLELFSNGSSLYILTKKKLEKNTFDKEVGNIKKSTNIFQKFLTNETETKKIIEKRESFLSKDFEYVKSIVKKNIE